MTELRLGSRGPDVSRYTEAMNQRYASYSKEPDGVTPLRDDGYFGASELAVHNQWQGRMKRPMSVGWDWKTVVSHEEYDFIVHGVLFPQSTFGHVRIYSAAGTGATNVMGPQFVSANWLKGHLGCQHWALVYPAGGFLGLMGGDPKLSYNESIANLGVELERCIDIDITDPKWEGWFFGYSQSADAIKRCVARLFGDGGKYADKRDRVKGLVLFGDPTRAPGPTKVGNNPKGLGIARWSGPGWLEDRTHSITTHFDMYACADNELLPLFYEWFTRAELEIGFVIYCAQIVIPAIMSLVAPTLGVFSPAAVPLLAGLTNLSGGLIGQLLGGISGAGQPNPKLLELLTLQGVLGNLPKLLGLLIALGGIRAHGEYHLPKTEFGGRTGEMVACDIVRGHYGR